MISLLIIVQFVIVVIICIAVLLQKSSSIGLGAYSGSNESLFGAKGPAGFLAKFTFVMGVLLIVNTVALGYLYNNATKNSIVEKITIPNSLEANATNSAPLAPVIPSQSNTSEQNNTK